jgi:hypothetical protein
MSISYDAAQICTNGHLINGCVKARSERNLDFCENVAQKQQNRVINATPP